MRLFEIDRYPKPSMIIPYGDDGEAAEVFVRPSMGTVLKCIGNHDGRALIYASGMLVVWYQNDMYHDEVTKALSDTSERQYLQLTPPGKFPSGVVVKGESEEEIVFADPKWLAILHGNRTLVQIYGADFLVSSYNWY